MSSNNTSANARKNKMLIMIYLFGSAAVSNASLRVTVCENDGNT